jgi:hypothetical protein
VDLTKTEAKRLAVFVESLAIDEAEPHRALAELRKQYPALTSEPIRDVLAAAEAQAPATAQGYSGSGETVGERQPEPKPATNRGTTDKTRAKAAAKGKASAPRWSGSQWTGSWHSAW